MQRFKHRYAILRIRVYVTSCSGSDARPPVHSAVNGYLGQVGDGERR